MGAKLSRTDATSSRLVQKMPLLPPSYSAINGGVTKKKEDEGKKEAIEKLGEDKGERLQTLVVTWDDAEIADYFDR